MYEWFLEPVCCLKQRSLILLVTSNMVDVFMKAGLPVESCETKIISKPTDHQWSILIIKELWSRQVEGLERFKKVYYPPQ